MPEARVAAIPPSEASAPGSTGKKGRFSQMFIQLLACDACLDTSVEIFGVDLQNMIYLRQ